MQSWTVFQLIADVVGPPHFFQEGVNSHVPSLLRFFRREHDEGEVKWGTETLFFVMLFFFVEFLFFVSWFHFWLVQLTRLRPALCVLALSKISIPKSPVTGAVDLEMLKNRWKVNFKAFKYNYLVSSAVPFFLSMLYFWRCVRAQASRRRDKASKEEGCDLCNQRMQTLTRLNLCLCTFFWN